MKIFLGTDHAGFAFKEEIKSFLLKKQYDVEDCGAYEFDKDDDYPDFIAKAARQVAKTPGSFGIVLGKSGAGECIVANKINGIRAFLAVNKENVLLARQHNDANVISFGSSLLSVASAKELLLLFLTTPFSQEERHKRRIDKITQLEQS